jgi:Tol biopolymer transport system component
VKRFIPIVALVLTNVMLVEPVRASTPAGTSGKIAFTRCEPDCNVRATFTIEPDGSHEVLVAQGVPWIPDCQAWSPDGSRLAVCTFNAAGFVRPATVNADGSDFTLLDAYPNLELNFFSCVEWSPDASRLLCGSQDDDRPANDGIYTVRSSDGGDLMRVTSTPEGFQDMPVGYSPDGTRILFLRNDPNGNWGDLFEVNPDGTGLLKLNPADVVATSSSADDNYQLDSCCGVDADWSPDGSLIAFGARVKVPTGQSGHGPNGGSAHFAIFIVNRDGSGLVRITPTGLDAGRDGLSWSPDGQSLAFSTRFHTVSPQIWVIHPDGTGMQELTHPASSQDVSVGPVWSPDSTQILFQSFRAEIGGGQEDLWIVNVDDSRLRQLTSPLAPFVPGEEAPTWGRGPG